MEYKEVLGNLQKNKKLSKEGLNEYIQILKNENTNLRLKIIDLEYKIQNKKNAYKKRTV